MRFLIDAQLPPALAAWLIRAGHEATHVDAIGLRHAKDTPIWNYAIEHDTIIVTKDDDFRGRRKQSRSGPIVVWLSIGNASRAALIEWFNPRFATVLAQINAGETLVEVY